MKMKQIFALLFTCAVAQLSQAQTMKDAINELQNENYIKAKQGFLSLKGEEQTLESFLYLGNVYLNLGATDSAQYYYQKAELATDAYGSIAKARLAIMTNKDSNEVKAHIEKALSQSKRRSADVFFQAAYLSFQPKPSNAKQFIGYAAEAHRLAPNNHYYTLVYGDLYLAMGEGGKAMGKYEDVVAADPNNVLANIRIGSLYYASMNYPTAIEFLEKANALNPNFSVAHKELGELYFHTKQNDKAAAEFKKYILLNDNDARIKSTYSGFLYQLKEYQKAIDECNIFKATDSTNYTYYRIIAYSNFELKKYKEAQASINKFWKYSAGNKITALDYGYSGKIAGANNDTSSAIKYLKSAVTLDTNNADLQSEYAKALYTAKRYKESISEYKRRVGMRKSPGSLDYYYLGRAYFSNGEYVCADTSFADFSRMQPKSPDGYLWRAKSLVEQEDVKNLKGLGSAYYLKYIELASSDISKNKSNLVSAYTYLAYVALTQNDNVKAKEYFGKLLEVDPENKNAQEEVKKLAK
jgi:tetratricopeptide (TPR) repeat protein